MSYQSRRGTASDVLIIGGGVIGCAMTELLLTGRLAALAQPFSLARFLTNQERLTELIGQERSLN